MIKIPLSRVGSAEAFAAAVEAHRKALEDHRNGETGTAAPVHESDLVASVVGVVPDTGPVAKRGPDRFVILPYEIEDDSPSLAERKQQLLGQANAAAIEAQAKILSPARQRLLNLQAGDAFAVEEAKRTADQVATIQKLQDFHAACAVINRKLAEVAVEIEDLTEATIGAWTVPAF